MIILRSLLGLILLVQLASCVNTRPIQYVQGKFDTAKLNKVLFQEPVFQKADLLSIIVYSDNPEATSIYNLPNSAGAMSGYLVDDTGNIRMQGIGTIHVEGLTKKELIEQLTARHSVYLKNVYYNIRYINFKVTLLGELGSEGQFNIPNEKVNIFEAIGLAGGMTVYGRRENVMVIREVNGKREFGRLDLTSPEVFNSPFYNLQQNDLIVVEQTKNKLQNTDQTTARNISLATSIISTLVFLYTVFR